MAWSLDWFSAEESARAGAPIRRVAWTDRWLVWANGFMWIAVDGAVRWVKTTDYTAADLRARDWTTEPFTADPCAATPAYNTAGPQYRAWEDETNRPPPPPPGFPDAA